MSLTLDIRLNTYPRLFVIRSFTAVLLIINPGDLGLDVCPRGRMVKVAASQTGSVRSRGPGFNPWGRQARLRLPIYLEI